MFIKIKRKIINFFEKAISSKAISTINSDCRYGFYKEEVPISLEKYKTREE